MKILVLGGTGAMGSHLVNMLAENKCKVFVTSRSYRKSTSPRLNYIIGDAKEKSFIESILEEQWDAIVDFMVYSTGSFDKRLDVLLNATDQYIYLSSSRVYAESNIPITESSPRLLDVTTDKEYLATDEYALSKARQEDLLFNSQRNNWTIIRPYITYNEQRLQLGVLEKEAWLYRALNNRPIAFSKDINEKTTTLTYGQDVAKGIMAIIGENSALGEAFHITNPKSLKWREVLDLYKSVLVAHQGYDSDVVLQDMGKFSAWHQGKYQIQCDRLFNRVFDNSKINKYLDTSKFVDTTIGLKMCLKQFLLEPKYSVIDWKKEAIKDKQLQVWTSLSEISSFKQKIKYLIFRNPYINVKER